MQSSCTSQVNSPLPPGSSSCPPPLRCRDISALLDEAASFWELSNSPVGTHGWCWGDGPTVFLLGSQAVSARLSCLLAYLLRDEFRCILVDWKLEKQRRPVDISDFVGDLHQLIQTNGDSQATFVASSFGALVALQTLAENPLSSSRLVLSDAACRFQLSLAERVIFRWFRQSSRRMQEFPYWKSIQETNHRHWFPPMDPYRWDWFLEITGEFPLALYVAQSELLSSNDLTPVLPRVSCPVLLVQPEGLGPRAIIRQNTLAEKLPNSRTVPMHSTGRLPGLTHPHRLAKLVRQFIHNPASIGAMSEEPSFFPLKSS